MDTINLYGNEYKKLYTDEQYEYAKLLVSVHRKASVMMINRAVTHSYYSAAQIIDRLEQEGHISAYLGSRPREVYIPYPYEIHNGEGI
ncbi:DNA translocase FtsK [Brevibacillus laterosporus]|uniref:DNA translocase FtsK n=1 Tax=Brevibacillus laterosporus TaxID=1465 RepID=UPI003D1DCE7F